MLSTKKCEVFRHLLLPPPGKKLPFLPSSCSTLLIKYKPNISVLSLSPSLKLKSLCHSENPSNPVSKVWFFSFIYLFFFKIYLFMVRMYSFPYYSVSKIKRLLPLISFSHFRMRLERLI